MTIYVWDFKAQPLGIKPHVLCVRIFPKPHSLCGSIGPEVYCFLALFVVHCTETVGHRSADCRLET